MVLGDFQCQCVLLIWIIVGKRPTEPTVDEVGGCVDIFSLASYHLFSFSLSREKQSVIDGIGVGRGGEGGGEGPQ